MKYKKRVEQITKTLKEFMETIDDLEGKFLQEKKQHEQELSEMHGKYTEQYINEYTQNWKPKVDYADVMAQRRAEARLSINYSMDQLKKQIDNYFNSPVRAEFANRINAISLTGLSLSNREFQVLAENVSGYMECRLLNHLAMSRTKERTDTVIKDKQPVFETREVSDAYLGVKLPDIDSVYEVFESYRNCTDLCLDNYTGANGGLFRFLGRKTPIASNSYFRLDMPKQLSDILENANKLLPENRVKRELSPEEKALVNLLVNENYPILAKSRVKELAEADEDMAALLSRDDRYSQYLVEAEEA